MANMTPRQKRFADEYLIDLNGTQAAIRAGYSKKTANEQAVRLLANISVKEYIEARMAEKEKELIADQDEVLQYLTRVLRGNSEAAVLARDEIGADRVITKQPDEKERLKAAELLGKRYSLFTDKIHTDAPIPVVITGADDLED